MPNEELAADIVKGKRHKSYTSEEISRHDELAARKLLDRGLDALGIALSDLRLLRQNDPRKQALAWLIRTKTIVADDWITQHLDMGDRSNVSRAVSALRSPTQTLRRRLPLAARMHGLTPIPGSSATPAYLTIKRLACTLFLFRHSVLLYVVQTKSYREQACDEIRFGA